MLIMPANVTSPEVRGLMREFPDCLGNLFSPGAWRKPHGLFALDNGRFPTKNRTEWSERAWLRLIDKAMGHRRPPEWVLCPDVPFDWSATLREWERWIPFLRQLELPIAVAAQEGATVESVRTLGAQVVFIGGRHSWKWTAAQKFVEAGFRTHVGRVNTPARALACFDMGVESVDGTGWMQTDRQRAGLRHALEMMTGMRPRPLLLWRENGLEDC